MKMVNVKRIISGFLCCAISITSIATMTSFKNLSEKNDLKPISVSMEKPTEKINLTEIGDIDWVHKTSETEERKEIKGNNILKIEPLSSGEDYGFITEEKSPVDLSWDDGTINKKAENIKKCGVYNYKNNDKDTVNIDITDKKVGYKITVPAADKPQILTILTGALQAETIMSFYANGDKTPSYINNEIKAYATSVNRKCTVNIRANTDLVIECSIYKKKGPIGNVTLSAVTLGNFMVDNNFNVTSETAEGSMNLTDIGNMDWLHITGTSQDIDSKPIYTRKNIDAPLIDFNLLPDNGALTIQNDSKVQFSWTDGNGESPVVTNSKMGGVVTYLPGDDQSIGKIPDTKNIGYTIAVKNNEKTKCLTFVTGLWQAKGKVSIFLNGKTIADYETTLSADGTAVCNKYIVNLSPKDSVVISCKLTEKTNNYGNISVGAVTLGENKDMINHKEQLSELLSESENFDVEGIDKEKVDTLNAEIKNSNVILKDDKANDINYYEAYVFLKFIFDDVLNNAKDRRYANSTLPGLVSSFGWEGDLHAPISFIDGTYKLRDNQNKIINFGVWNIPGDIKWYNKEGYLPCFVSEYSKNELSHIVENFADLVEVGNEKFEVAYSRMTTTNKSNEVKKLSRVSRDLTPLNDFAKNAVEIKPGETIVRDYAISADRFGNLYDHLTDDKIAAEGSFDEHYIHMKEYWNNRLSEISEISKLPDEKLINAYKAGYIYTLIIRDDVKQTDGSINYQLHVGENGYDEMYDHDTIGIVASLLTMGDFKYAKEYLTTLPAQLQYDDAKWKYSWPYAMYLQKTGDFDFIKYRYEDIKRNTHFVESDRIDGGNGIIKKTNAIDSNGYWLIDNWAALTGLTTYKYLCQELFNNSKDEKYKKEIEWAENEYISLLAAVEKSQAELREKYDYDYLSISMEVPTEQSARSDPKDANWASMFLFGRWAWDGYLFGADQTNSKMIELIDDTYSHGFDRRKEFTDTIYNFGGYPHGIFSSAYNAGYGSGALRGEKYRDSGIKAYQFMVNEAQSGPFGWWEGVDYPKESSSWDINHARGGGGSCQHMWGQSTASKVLFDSLISEKSDGSVIIGRGVPVEWITEGKEIEVKNYTVSKDTKIGFNIQTKENEVIISLTGDNSKTDVSLELLAFKNNISDANGLDYDNQNGIVKIPAGTKTATITLKDAPIAHNITVEGGQSDKKTAVKGESVYLTADKAPTGKTFEKWISTDANIVFDNETSEKTAFVMTQNDVTIKAQYTEKIIPHSITVIDGKADKKRAKLGETIVVTANEAPNGKSFDKWISDSGNVVFVDEKQPTTKFEMPNEKVQITATYKMNDVDIIQKIDGKTNIEISGAILPDSIFEVVTVGDYQNELSNLYEKTKNLDILSAYKMSITENGFIGGLTLKIPVDSKYNDKSIIINHQLFDGSIVSYEKTCIDGKVEIQIDELGSFMLGTEKSDESQTSVPDNSDTSEKPSNDEDSNSSQLDDSNIENNDNDSLSDSNLSNSNVEIPETGSSDNGIRLIVITLLMGTILLLTLIFYKKRKV